MPTAYTSTSDSRIICRRSSTCTSELVSLPSEITTSARLRLCPRCASGIASATVSYIAVPPARHDAPERRRHPLAIRRPPLLENRLTAEAVEEELVVRIQQVGQEVIERLLRVLEFLTSHAAARVERNAKTDRHTFGAEMRDGLWLFVFVQRRSRRGSGPRRTVRSRRSRSP